MKVRIIYNNKTNEVFEIIASNNLCEKEDISVWQSSDIKIYEKLKNYKVVNMKNDEPVFEEKQNELTHEEKLEKELLETKAVIVDLKYKEILEKEGR